MQFNSNNEKQLVKGCIRNDRKCQEMLYRLYADEMFAVCRAYSKDYQIAKDVLHDGFIKIFEKIKTYKQHSALRGWMRKVFVNTAIDYYRKSIRLNSSIVIEDSMMEPIDNQILEKISVKQLLDVLKELPPGFRMVFNLYVIEGYSHNEIAEKLGISTGTSKSQLSRAKKSLQQKVLQLYESKYLLYAKA
ncbi:MAG: RNA polymerase subunit sigma-24 [Flavobacteriales bacterium]|nr:RNA polymerase sigma factor [Bacteroidales bacterium AH-315-I05]PCJ81343.1 MAG: RNA polymerase subunit sigma-24 [Flavobacteriales bacterium]